MQKPLICTSKLSPSALAIAGGVGIFIALSAAAGILGQWKVLTISWIAFCSMAGAIPLGIIAANHGSSVMVAKGYSLAAGAIITAAAIFLIPEAVHHRPAYGGLGIAVGIILGYAMHNLNFQWHHRSWIGDVTVAKLVIHTISEGIVIGFIYHLMPKLSIVVGVAIILHKGPAAYAAACRLKEKGSSPLPLLIPSCATGLAALSISLINMHGTPIANALIDGLAAGIFFHIGLDFLPAYKTDTEIERNSDIKKTSHVPFKTLQVGNILTIFAGGFVVFALWYLIH